MILSIVFKITHIRSDGNAKWFSYILGSTTHLLNVFHRFSTAVLAPHLLETFKVSNTSLGLLSSVYFFSYAAIQPIAGLLTDRWKPRKMLTIFILIMTIGTLIFAYSPTFMFACIGKLLIGIGSAGLFIPVSDIITKYFIHDKRGFLYAISIFYANIGSVLATSPFEKLINLFGWRNALAGVAFISFTLALLIWLVLRDNNSNKIGEATKDNKDSKNIIEVVKEKTNWCLVIKEIFNISIIKYCIIGHFAYSATLSFQGLWAVPFFMDVYKMEESSASDLVTIIPLGFLVGLLLLSKFNDTKYGKYIFFSVNVLSLIIYLIFAIFTIQMPYTLILILLFLIGFSNSMVPYLFKIYSLVLPKRHYCTALGILNAIPFILSALYQSSAGLLFDLFGEGAHALHRTTGSYKLYFLFLVLSLIIVPFSLAKMIKILNKDYKDRL